MNKLQDFVKIYMLKLYFFRSKNANLLFLRSKNAKNKV